MGIRPSAGVLTVLDFNVFQLERRLAIYRQIEIFWTVKKSWRLNLLLFAIMAWEN